MPKQLQSKGAERPLSFRPSVVTKRQLEALMDTWGESQSDVIARCIERCWTQECFVDEEDNLFKQETIK